jgi:uncharacterized protein (DUF1697 family)
MKTYIALLRGINVGGHNIIKMPDLVQALSEHGFQEVKTYIQSGNVVFKAMPNPEKEIIQSIRQIIQNKFDLNTPVILRDLDSWKTISRHHPLLPEGENDTKKYAVTFLSDSVHQDIEIPFETVDQFKIMNREIYSFYPNGAGKSKLTNTFFEKKLNVFATTRNWRTVNKLLEIAQS